MQLAHDYFETKANIAVTAPARSLVGVVGSLTFKVQNIETKKARITIMRDQTAVSFELENI